MSGEDYTYLSNLAKECLVNRRTISILESTIRAYKDRLAEVKAELADLKAKCNGLLMKKRQRPSDKSSPYVLKDLDRHRSQSGSKPQRCRHLRNIGLVSAGIAVNRPPFRIIGVRQQLQIFLPNRNTAAIRSTSEAQQNPSRTKPKLKGRRKNGKSSRTLIRQS